MYMYYKEYWPSHRRVLPRTRTRANTTLNIEAAPIKPTSALISRPSPIPHTVWTAPFGDMIDEDEEDANFLAALMGMDLPEVAPPAPPAPPPPPAPPAAPTATYQAPVTIVNNYYAQPPTATRRDGR